MKAKPTAAPPPRRDPAREQLIQEYTEDKKRFVRGFVNFTIDRGFGALSPREFESGPKKGKRMTWQEVGRLMYGEALFNQVMREELAARKAPQCAQG